MKRNDISTLHDKTMAELHQSLAELRVQLGKIQVEKKANKLANPRLVSMVRDDIARIKTVMTEKTLTEALLSEEQEN